MAKKKNKKKDKKIEEEQEFDNWVEAMIHREAVPEPARKDTVTKFCKKWKIGESTYYYQSSKKENQERIIDLSIHNAKKHAPEVLENLGVRAKSNKDDAKLYLQFILNLAEKLQVDNPAQVEAIKSLENIIKTFRK